MPRFLLTLFLLAVISGSLFWVYKNFFSSFYPDVNEVQRLPPDVAQIEKRISLDPIFATSSANPLLKSALPEISKSIHFRIPILMYHYVEHVGDQSDQVRISLNTLPEILDLQIKTLKDAGYTFLTPAEIPSFFEGQRALPNKPIILSFDDGYRDFYTGAFPLIKKYQVKAINYVVSGFLDKPNNLTRKQLKEIAQSNLVEIGVHTVDHVNLRGMDPQKAKGQIEKSKSDLEKELGLKVVSFAYPYGAFDLKTVELVKNANFETAASTVPGVDVNMDNLYFLYRLRPGGKTGQALLNLVETAK